MNLEPGKYSSNFPIILKSEEVIVCIKGTVELHVYDNVVVLNEGDSARIEKTLQGE